MVRVKFVVQFFFLVQCSLMAQVSWQKMSSPNEDVTCLAAGNNNVIYAGTVSYGVFKSADEGQTWLNISQGLPDSIIRDVEVATDHKLYCGTGVHGIYQYNAGSWVAINNGLGGSTTLVSDFARGLNGIVYMMNNAGAVFKWDGNSWTDITYNLPGLGKCLVTNKAGQLYAGVFNSGVYRFDGVGVWSLVGDPMPNNFVIKLAISKVDTLIAVCNSNNVYRCAAAGGPWIAANAGLPATNMTCIHVDTLNRWFISTSSAYGALYRSTNNGASWSNVSSSLLTTKFNCLTVSPVNKIYAGASGVFRSADGGNLWQDMNAGMDAARIMLCFKCTQNGTFYIGNKLGVWRSINGGQTWQLRNTGINHYNVLQIMETEAGSLLFHAYNSVPKGAIYRSVNQGDSWTQVAANGCDFYTKLKQHKSDTLWAASRFSGATSLSYSTNDGLNWQNNPLMISAIWDLDVSKEHTVFLGSESEGVSRSDNGGQSFNLGVGNTTSWYGNVIEIERDENGYIFAGGDWWTNILWYSKPEENGDNWTKFNDPDLVVRGIQDLVFDYHNNVYLACETNGCRMAYNTTWSAGTDWLSCNTGLPSATANLLEMSFDTSGFLYSVCSATNGHNAGLFRTVTPVQPPNSAVYKFTGNGNWTLNSNWKNGHRPATNVSGNKIIMIDPEVNGECLLNGSLNLSNGAKLKIYPGKKLRIQY